MSETIDPHTMYLYNNHRNIPWNIVQYQPVVEDIDPEKMVLQKNIKQGKYPTTKYATKRGFYMDRHIKNVKDLPEPGHYKVESSFDQTKNKKKSKRIKIDFKLKKNTYIDQIQRKVKRAKSPSVGNYSLNFQHEITHKKPKKISDKRYFYEQNQFLSTVTPGSFCYYPREQVPHIKTDRTTYKLWIDKHKKERASYVKKKSKQPAPGTYRPISAQNNTFDRIKVKTARQKSLNKGKTVSSGFGSSDTKFEYERKDTKVIKQKRPSFSTYDVSILWKNKKTDPKKKGWSRCVSAGPTRGVYH